MLTGNYKGEIKLWDLELKECIITFDGHKNEINCIKKASDNILISGSSDGSIKIWNIETG